MQYRSLHVPKMWGDFFFVAWYSLKIIAVVREYSITYNLVFVDVIHIYRPFTSSCFRFSVMFSCWNEDPKKRPTFGTLQEALEKIEKEQTVLGSILLQTKPERSIIMT